MLAPTPRAPLEAARHDDKIAKCSFVPPEKTVLKSGAAVRLSQENLLNANDYPADTIRNFSASPQGREGVGVSPADASRDSFLSAGSLVKSVW